MKKTLITLILLVLVVLMGYYSLQRQTESERIYTTQKLSGESPTYTETPSSPSSTLK